MAINQLSNMQRRILLLMRGGVMTKFDVNGRRSFTHRELLPETIAGLGWPSKQKAIIIRAYQNPDHFLRARGLIAAHVQNKLGVWFKITPEGERRVANMRKEPA